MMTVADRFKLTFAELFTPMNIFPRWAYRLVRRLLAQEEPTTELRERCGSVLWGILVSAATSGEELLVPSDLRFIKEHLGVGPFLLLHRSQLGRLARISPEHGATLTEIIGEAMTLVDMRDGWQEALRFWTSQVGFSESLFHPNPDVRRRVVRDWLVEVRPICSELLRRLSVDETDSQVREAAAETLGRRLELLQALSGEEARRREGRWYEASERKLILRALNDGLDDPDSQVRRRCAEALAAVHEDATELPEPLHAKRLLGLLVGLREYHPLTRMKGPHVEQQAELMLRHSRFRDYVMTDWRDLAELLIDVPTREGREVAFAAFRLATREKAEVTAHTV